MSAGPHDDTLKFIGHPAKIFLARTNIGQMCTRQAIDVVAGQTLIAGQLQEAADLFQTEAQIPPSRDEPQALDIGARINPITTVRAGGVGQQPDLLVVADGFKVASAGFGSLTDLHGRIA